MSQGAYTLSGFLKAMEQIQKLGAMRSIMKMIPGMGRISAMMDQMGEVDPDKEIRRIRGMISSMTLAERNDPDNINPSRQARIARGSGVSGIEVADLLAHFGQMCRLMMEFGQNQKKHYWGGRIGWQNG